MALAQGFHHVALKVPADQFDRSAALYQALGGVVVNAWGENEKRALMIDMGGSCVELFASGTEQAEENARFAHLCLRTPDVQAAYDAALAAGAQAHRAPREMVLGELNPTKVCNAFVICFGEESIEFFDEI